MIDRTKLFAGAKSLFGTYGQEQVDGINLIVDEFERRQWPDKRHLAYILATVQHETASTMQPVREIGRGKNYKYGIPDAQTGRTYYGRGYVQLTWKRNYIFASAELVVDFVNNPDLVMAPEYALDILFDGMGEGWFAGAKGGTYNLTWFFNDKRNDPVEARRIINGMDKAEKIAAKYAKWLAALGG